MSYFDFTFLNNSYNETSFNLCEVPLLLLDNFPEITAAVIKWLLLITAVMFIFPMGSVLFLCYIIYTVVHSYKFWYNLKEDDEKAWMNVRRICARIVHTYGRIMHGYECNGMENFPKTGPALLIFYHGTIPVDYICLVCEIFFKTQRWVVQTCDKFFFKMPGLAFPLKIMKYSTGSYENCVKALKEGNILAIGPGGSYEAIFGDENYEVLFRHRIGYAKIAIEAKVPIIPVFCKNVREGYRTMKWFRNYFLNWYNDSRMPVNPLYGAFPVKFRTYIGKPIPYDPSFTSEELGEKTKLAIENLIKKHQRLPGSILKALGERIWETEI